MAPTKDGRRGCNLGTSLLGPDNSPLQREEEEERQAKVGGDRGGGLTAKRFSSLVVRASNHLRRSVGLDATFAASCSASLFFPLFPFLSLFSTPATPFLALWPVDKCSQIGSANNFSSPNKHRCCSAVFSCNCSVTKGQPRVLNFLVEWLVDNVQKSSTGRE